MQELAPIQIEIIHSSVTASVFLEGPVGCGKTTVGTERLLYMMEQGVPGSSILLLVPQRTLAIPYYQVLNTPGVVAGGVVSILTVGGLAQRMVDLFWPLVVEDAGFREVDRPPTFLTLETAQYYMAHLVRPLLDKGYFETLTIDRNRLYSQILDNLNKAALVGFPYTQIGEQLKSAWVGEPGQTRVYEDAQYCASLFRDYCLKHNLLDFSLQIEVFLKHVWTMPVCREYLLETYRHMLADNLEEDTPAAHALIAEWLPDLDSALLIYDQGAGYRHFLGADPLGGYALRGMCDSSYVLNQSFITTPAVKVLGYRLAQALSLPGKEQFFTAEEAYAVEAENAQIALDYRFHRFYPEMLDWVTEEIADLVMDEGIPPSEIVVLAPYLSDALRFSLMDRLNRIGVPARSHRPSRSLREEPAVLCLLTLACLAHPSWDIHPARFDVAYAMMQAIEDFDLVRARLLVDIVYRNQKDRVPLSSFDKIKPDIQERITYRFGELFENLRLWLAEYSQGSALEPDHFFSRLFGEVLSQAGYGFHASYAAGEVTANLIESVQKFRWVAGQMLSEEGIMLGKEYMQMVQEGVIAAQYIRSWQVQEDNAILLAPAYTYLMSNRPVDYQFWLDVGSRGWSERLYQPLTHPYVLSRHWLPGKIWTDDEEYETSREALLRISLGLLRRCRIGVYLGLSELGEQGYEQRGPLLQALSRVLR